ncbi:MAG TPA: PilN domain-containing protein [Solirubrobacterales bacterium]|nr:PilN domain-containing protein [Solirubrobacterales bacterium]
MRPVNLIPAEERRGSQAPMRTGPLPYLLVGVLVAVLVGVTALVLTGNQIADSKDELVQLQREDAAAKARAERLVAFTQFETLYEQRLATIASLADSRFDWERVMRELSLVLPDDAWLVSLNATASPEASGGEGEGGSSLRGSVAGPALEISGCAAGQEAVAGFVTALKDIDGVTRVGVESSELPAQAIASSAGEGEAAGGGGNSDCKTRDFIAQFSLVVAFDAAPVPVAAAASGVPVATETAESSSTEGEEGAESEGG